MVQFFFTSAHVSMGSFFSFLSVVITVFVQWFSLPLLLNIFSPPNHKCSTSSLCILYGIYIYDTVCIRVGLILGYNKYSAFSESWCGFDPLLSGSMFVSLSQGPKIDQLPYSVDVIFPSIVHNLDRVLYFNQLNLDSII